MSDNYYGIKIEQVTYLDKYIRKNIIGSGSFGVVYKCIDRTNDKEYAIKVINIQSGIAETIIYTLLGCESKYTLCLHDKFIINEKIYIVLNYVENTIDFINYIEEYFIHIYKDYVIDAKPKAHINFIKECRNIFNIILDACRGIKIMHDKGMIHLDVKLDNILVADRRHGILIDYGLSCLIEDNDELQYKKILCKNKSTPGSYIYMAPEILNLQHITKPADIYSMGIVIYQIFFYDKTIDIEYSDSNHHPTKNLRTGEQIIPNIKINIIDPKFTNQLISTISKCIYKNPEERINIDQLIIEINNHIYNIEGEIQFIELFS